ncbi:MAG TPA: LacI family DNA-binding transcriptional regulator [Candidatus Sulfotelmatobacter sp.]|nr:LacI family DNA-binding transcriptional regulator [Candidatus Sulfotelmatobacter sp.]
MTKKTKAPTLSEVARKAGVGTTTVSRVINGGNRVDPRTLARVHRAIDALGYRPNQAARILKGHRTKTIGLIIPSIADSFFASCAEAAQAIARTHDCLLIVTTTQNDPAAEIESVKVLMQHQTDGLIIAPSDSDNGVLRNVLARAAVPVVALDRPLLDSLVPSVVADNFAGASVATQHLIGHGYKRIACLTGENTLYTIRERINGYRQAVQAAGLPVMLDTSITDYRSVENAIRRLLSSANPPDAMLTLKNSTTIGAFEVLQSLGVAIPGSVALLGYDDFELAQTVRPSISVVRQPIEEIGRMAAEILFQELLRSGSRGRAVDRGVAREVQLETRLVCRNSCGCSVA